MDEKIFDVEKLKAYWLTEAEEALEVAEHPVEKEEVFQWLKSLLPS